MAYILDLDNLSKVIEIADSVETQTITEETTDHIGNITIKTTKHESPKTIQVNTVKYDVIMNLLSVILNDALPDADLSLGVERAIESAQVEVQIAFNTLEHYGILKEI